MKKRNLIFVALAFAFVGAFQNCSQVAFENAQLKTLQSVAPLCTEMSASGVTPKLKWDWFANLDLSVAANYPDFSQVMSTPMVGDLNNDRQPEVVFVSWSKNFGYSSRGVLRIVNGATGQTIKSIGDLEVAPFASASPLLVDIDGDGSVEIFYPHYLGKSLVALNADGTKRWIQNIPDQTANVFTRKGFSATDIDKDGVAEIVIGRWAYTESQSRQPVLKWSASDAINAGLSTFAISTNLNSPQQMQMVGSLGLYDESGKKIYSAPPSNYSAADIDGVPGLELVGSASGFLRIVDANTGALKLDLDMSIHNDLKCTNGVGGGPATLGDFDGRPETTEIAIATGRYLTIFNGYGQLISKYPTQDCSSLSTGISSFDFNGDGRPEILYGDEEYFRIFEIRNGNLEVVWKTVNPSGTLNEYPVVADIDGNRSSEILVASNNYVATSFYNDPSEVGDKAVAAAITGVRAFESSELHMWMPTRSLWNQFDYNPAFVTDRLRPATSTPFDSFTSKMFRRNAQLGKTEQKCR